MPAENRPTWLPDGWTAVTKTTRSGAMLWCFHDPYTGFRFCSKKEVLQHLRTGKFRTPATKQTRSVATRSMKKGCTSTNLEENKKTSSAKNVQVQIENTPHELPHGWIKEMRLRKSGNKKDPFYIDPVSGYEFRSLKDVFRYIETGDIHRCANRPKKRSIGDIHALEKKLHTIPLQPSAAKSVEWRRAAVKKSLFSGGRHNSDVKMVIGINGSPGKSQLFLDDASGASVEEADSSCMTSVNVNHLDRGDVEDTKIVAELNATCEELNVSGEMLEPRKEQAMEPAIENPSATFSSHLSESLNETSHEPSLANQPNMGDECPSKESDKLQHGSCLSALEGNLLEGTNLILKEEESDFKKPKRTREHGSRKSRTTRTIMMPLRASPRLAALRADTVDKSALIEESSRTKAKPFHQLQVNSPSQDHSIKFTWVVNQQEVSPVVNYELFKKLESKAFLDEEATPEKLAELEGTSRDKPVSELTSPFGDSWPDPCIEFAFKTLIGDIPVFENTGVVQEYSHQQQLSSARNPCPKGSDSLALHNIGSLNQNEHLAQLEPPSNHMLPLKDNARPCFLENGQQSTKNLKEVNHWRSELNP